MPGWHRFGVPGVDRAAGYGGFGFGADRETCAAHCVPVVSVQNRAPVFPTAQSGQSAACGSRAADRSLGTPVDFSAARDVLLECFVLVDTADSGRRRGALALSRRSD